MLADHLFRVNTDYHYTEHIGGSRNLFFLLLTTGRHTVETVLSLAKMPLGPNQLWQNTSNWQPNFSKS